MSKKVPRTFEEWAGRVAPNHEDMGEYARMVTPSAAFEAGKRAGAAEGSMCPNDRAARRKIRSLPPPRRREGRDPDDLCGDCREAVRRELGAQDA